MRSLLFILSLLWISASIIAQDEVIYKEKKNGFYQDSILTGIQDYEKHTEKSKDNKFLSLDFDFLSFPSSPDDYESQWHNAPLSQGATGTCWCFATLSFLESEIYRKSGKQVKLSEMYIVYWEYVARAKYFVTQRGDMYFGQGSEANAVTRVIGEYGVVPASQYTGMRKGQKFHNHGPLAKEIKTYFDFIEKNNIWDEEVVVSNVKSILNHYLGTPPESITIDSKDISPVEYMQDVLELNPSDYFCFMSTKSLDYHQKGELVEPDNWWHNDDYYNITLDEFSGLFESVLSKGYTLSICGDVSEPGYDRYKEVGIIPTFDIPEEHINSDSREFRMNNGTTTDDHCIHIVGYKKQDGKLWYLIKDSSSSGFDGPNKGYRFIREDYVKLKILAIMAHKDAAREVLDKIIK